MKYNLGVRREELRKVLFEKPGKPLPERAKVEPVVSVEILESPQIEPFLEAVYSNESETLIMETHPILWNPWENVSVRFQALENHEQSHSSVSLEMALRFKPGAVMDRSDLGYYKPDRLRKLVKLLNTNGIPVHDAGETAKISQHQAQALNLLPRETSLSLEHSLNLGLPNKEAADSLQQMVFGFMARDFKNARPPISPKPLDEVIYTVNLPANIRPTDTDLLSIISQAQGILDALLWTLTTEFIESQKPRQILTLFR